MHENMDFICLKCENIREKCHLCVFNLKAVFKYFYIFTYKNMPREGYFGHFSLCLEPGYVQILFGIIEN
jgi:hypothetical protein